jgi:hypothetical protein
MVELRQEGRGEEFIHALTNSSTRGKAMATGGGEDNEEGRVKDNDKGGGTRGGAQGGRRGAGGRPSARTTYDSLHDNLAHAEYLKMKWTEQPQRTISLGGAQSLGIKLDY